MLRRIFARAAATAALVALSACGLAEERNPALRQNAPAAAAAEASESLLSSPAAAAAATEAAASSAPASSAPAASSAQPSPTATRAPTRKPAVRAAAPAAVLKRAQAKADGAGTVSYSMVVKTTLPGQGQVRMTGEGVSSLQPPVRGRMTMNMVMQGQQFAFETLITPKALFMKIPAEMRSDTRGKPWVRMSFADLSKAGGVDLTELLEQSSQSSPAAYIKALVAAGDVRESGTETIRGTATTRYSGVVTPDALANAYTGKLRDQVQSMLDQMGTEPMQIDLWVAADGYPRRMRQTMAVNGSATDVSIEFLKFGAKLDVTPPPAAQTIDLATLTGEKVAT